MIELLGKSKSELTEFCVSLGEPAYRGEQIYRALYAERKFDIAGMTNLPGPLREQLAAEARITLPIVRQRYVSKDGSVRYLFALPGDARNKGKDGFTAESAASMEPDRKTTAGSRLERPASVEAVFMPIESRQTICISTQAGCAVDCQFCLTAQLGLIRNLSSGEILAQVLLPLEEHKDDVAPQFAAQGKQTNVVLMGQGEPLLNFDNVMAAMRILLDQKGVGLPPRRVTISTSGIVPGIERLAQEAVRPKLAISLNASHDEQRNALMPINKKYPLKMLLDACKNYPLRPWEHLMFEYVMLGGVNDSLDDARRVARLLAPLKAAKVNLIPWNPGALPFHESSAEQIAAFRKVLTDRGMFAYVRYSRGRDVMAACGQLALSEASNSPLPVLS
ncbi:MAG TPA: 23S rRNA (adenine(2503)-C(2))-methyltransferase RlmN [Candidatus Eisenbacteria bacterium]|jgi:23S rRNA (adenine2503-C2)-methyltransferase|nr:23S rRNA (adenine(2503)-C(2))-methyltransferase RlmN [Candidatus Eisenbacteria bacterium]